MKVGIALAAYRPPIDIFIEQLASIQSQTYSHWICTVTSDSPLATILELPEFQRFIKDPRFYWLENPIRLGHKKNFERAIQESLRHTVHAIACSDQDDIWYPNKLAECVQTLKQKGPLSLVHSDMHILENGKIAPLTAWLVEHRGIMNCRPKHLYVRNIVAGCSMMFDAELARRFPTIPEEAEFHDHWYALVAAYHGGIQAIPTPLYAYRQHPENEVGVSPFKRIFSMPAGSTLLSLLKKCQKGWIKSFRLATAAQREGLPITFLEKAAYLWPAELGLSLFFLGIFNGFADRPLTRACLARSIGKLVSFGRRS